MKRLALLSSLCAFAASATTLVAVDVPALSVNADAIVIGTVQSSKARLTLDGSRVITDTEIKVSEVLKGKAEGSVVVMQPGGVVGELGQRVEGTAPFAAGEEVLLFLDRRGSDHFIVTAMVQGKYRLLRSSDGKEITAIPETASGARLVDPRTHQETASGLKPLSLPVLKAQIAAAIAGPQPAEHSGPKQPLKAVP
jgi:hypothetical protein